MLAFALLGVEFFFAEAEVFGRNFEKFVVFDEVQALFEAEDRGRGQLDHAVG
jgi:hypothetical protein